MKSMLRLTTLLSTLTVIFLFTSCDKEDLQTAGATGQDEITVRGGKGNNNGKGKGNQGDGSGGVDPVPIDYDATYQISEVDDPRPLYKFSIATTGDLMLLQTDPSITSWGTDYWGYWADPFPYADGIVHYIDGLTEVTYEFSPLSGDKFDVTETLRVTSYNSGAVTTTVWHLGIYSRVE